MKLGLSTLLFPDDSPESGIKLASELGLEYVEIVLDVPHFPLEPDPDWLKKVQKLVDSTGLEVRTHGRFLDINPVSPYPEMRDFSLDQTEESIEICDSLNGEMVTVHPGRCWFREDEKMLELCEKWFHNYLKKASSYAQERGITLAVETGSHSADYPGDPKKLFQTVDRSDVGVTLDVGHLYLSAEKRDEGEVWISDWIRKKGDKLVNVHLHDNSGLSDEHLPLGEGEIDFAPIVDALKKNYDGPIILELFDVSDPYKDVKRSVDKIEKF